MKLDEMWGVFNRLLTGGNITGDEAIALLHWMLLPDDEEENESEN